MFCVNNWIANPTHRIKVLLVGLGGTGSHIAVELAQLSNALKEMDRMPLEIVLVDPDIVEDHNIGRQKFYPCDVGENKAMVLAGRINRVFLTDVEYIDQHLTRALIKDLNSVNIIISAVDNLATRKMIHKYLKHRKFSNGDYQNIHYWFDAGNSEKSGQIIMASYGKKKLPSIIDRFPNIKEKKNEPSCSMRASLLSQGFMINKMTAFLLMEMFSSLILDYCISYNEVYFDLDNMNLKTNEI